MIPMANDVAALVGDYAQAIENRSLLFEKFSIPKRDLEGTVRKEAGRWSVLRIVSRGGELLRKDSGYWRDRSRGRNVEPQNADRFEEQAHFLEKISSVALLDTVAPVAIERNRRFLDGLRKSSGSRLATFEARLGGRLLVNLAGGVVENAGMALDRCFGLPFLPGSAVKGIARAAALTEISDAVGEQKLPLLQLALQVFGYGKTDLTKGDFFKASGSRELALKAAGLSTPVEAKGCISFLPGLPLSIPKMVVDMINSHYPEYYQGKRSRAQDNENPIPNYFPAVEAGTVFGFALALCREPANGTCEKLLAQARKWTETAITVKGAGAKTAAGYGWFQVGGFDTRAAAGATAPGEPAQAPVQELSLVDQIIRDWQGKLRTKDNFPAALPKMNALPSTDDLRRVFESVIPEQERLKLRKGNPYWQSFTSGKHEKDGKKILERLGIKLS